MPTLLSINNYHYVRGGAEFVFLEHNKLFSQSGWNVIPFCMKHTKNLPSKSETTFVDELELDSAYGAMTRLSKAMKAIYSFEARRKLASVIRESVPDVAHGHNIYHHISPSILSLLKQRGIPTVLTLHDLKIACPAYRMITHDGICERCKGGRLFNAALNRCMHGSFALSAWVTLEAFVHRLLDSYGRNVDRFIVPSKFYSEKLAEWGWPSDKFAYVPNFVNAKNIRPDFNAGKEFTYFGRLSNEKGLATLVRAAARIGAKLQIIGTGPESENLQALAVELGVDAEFPGYLSGEALFGRLRAARAIVIPSEWYENAPISVLEAYACGKPVIGANIGGIPELIDTSRGKTFEAFSEESLAAALDEFSKISNEKLAEIGRNGREYVNTFHSEEVYLKNCSALYETLMT